jgi:integrase
MMAGLRQRHGLNCKGGRCACPWEASVYSKADCKKLRKTFATRGEAVEWQQDSRPRVRQGAMRAPTAQTIREASVAWLEGARSGLIRTRSGRPYKPAAIRAYDDAMRLRVLSELGSKRLGDVTRNDVQDLVDKLQAAGSSASTIRVSLLPLRAIYRRAINRGTVMVNPTTGLEVPAERGGRDRIASPDECGKLLAALGQGDRALWATAMYGGLRRGELRALRIEDVDLARGAIHVRRGWDALEGEITTKSGKDRRVPIALALRDYLDQQLLGLDWHEGLVFGSTAGYPFEPTAIAKRAKRVWKAAKVQPITLHECSHTFASLMIAAGVNAKALSTYVGHATISITLDRYGHLMPGNEKEAAGMLDAYLERADTAARLVQISAD